MSSRPLRSGRALSEAIGYHGSVSDSDLADNHYRIVGGDRLMWSGRATTWARQSAPLCPRADRGYRPNLSPARQGCRRLCVVRHRRPFDPPHAADRRTRPRRVAGERLRRPRSQHHGDGRQSDCPRHRRWRSNVAAVYAVRTGLGRRTARPHGRANILLDETLSRRSRRAPRRRRRDRTSPRAPGRYDAIPRGRTRDGAERAGGRRCRNNCLASAASRSPCCRNPSAHCGNRCANPGRRRPAADDRGRQPTRFRGKV